MREAKRTSFVGFQAPADPGPRIQERARNFTPPVR